MKKILSMILVMAMVLTVVSVTAYAIPRPVLTLETSNLVNNMITVEVNIKNNPGISSFGLRMKYDNDKLLPVDANVTDSVFAGNNLVWNFKNVHDNELGYVELALVSTSNILGDGKVLSVTFELKNKLDTSVENTFEFYVTYPGGIYQLTEGNKTISHQPTINNAVLKIPAVSSGSSSRPSTGGNTDVKVPEKDVVYKPAQWTKASDWAVPELKAANNIKVIPEILDNKDMTQSISRQEFAALSVKLYETLSGKKAEAGPNPFKDTDDVEILKAYNLGITKGMSDTEFGPELLITREQVATMLFRTIEIANGNQKFDSSKSEKFGDTSDISDYAVDSVYFMKEKDIIKGVGDNKFDPKANTTREASIAIAVRSYYNL